MIFIKGGQSYCPETTKKEDEADRIALVIVMVFFGHTNLSYIYRVSIVYLSCLTVELLFLNGTQLAAKNTWVRIIGVSL